MATINQAAEVRFSPAQMYDLVNDIQHYPEFLPHCSDSKIIEANEDEVKASLTLEWNGIQKTFSTSNHLQTNKMIEVRLLEGPFNHLEGFWRFEPLDNGGCNIAFDLEFEIAGQFISMVFGPIFQQIMSKIVDAFVKRAEEVYSEHHAD